MVSKLHYGLRIEERACQWFLARRVATLFARNYRCRVGEIDLIFEEVRDDGTIELVFVEVRARVGDSPGAFRISGIESVNPVKQRKLTRAIEHFLVRYRGVASSLRVDVLDWNGAAWAHLIDARILDWR